MKNFVSRFAKDESGATAIEYGLIAAIVSVGIITVLGLMSAQLNVTFQAITDGLSEANGG